MLSNRAVSSDEDVNNVKETTRPWGNSTYLRASCTPARYAPSWFDSIMALEDVPPTFTFVQDRLHICDNAFRGIFLSLLRCFRRSG